MYAIRRVNTTANKIPIEYLLHHKIIYELTMFFDLAYLIITGSEHGHTMKDQVSAKRTETGTKCYQDQEHPYDLAGCRIVVAGCGYQNGEY